MRIPFHLRMQVAVLALAAISSLPSWAGDVAVLHNGFSIKHERREVRGAVTRLYLTADGASYVDIATTDIDHFEKAPDEQALALGLRASAGSSSQTRNSSNTGSTCHPSDFSSSPQSDCSGPQPDLNELVNAASGRYRLDPDLVTSVIKAESGFNVRAVSPKGAQGLMQLMPGTAGQLGVPNAFDPQANVEGGTRYLRELLERYNFDMVRALAAYNAGPQRVEQYGGVPPYYETRAYVARIVKDFNRKKEAAGKNVATRSASTQKSPTHKSASEGKVTTKTRAPAHAALKTATQAQASAKATPTN
jgi:Transglycosylase SLT domain